MTRYGQTRQSLDKHSLAPKKRFGQNFLVNKHTAEAIVRAGGVDKDDVVVEVGVGLGALTQPLAEQARKVIGVEIDSGIIRFHEDENDLPENVTLIHQDILKADFRELMEQCGGPLKIMANLPYSISNPFIFKLIENRIAVTRATIMLQKEVAERLMARPATKEYGVPSVLLQSCATIRKMMTLKPAEFHPRPKIDSVVIRIDFSHTPFQSADGTPFSFKYLQRIVRTTFNQRRKTILNTLSGMSFSNEEGIADKAQAKQLAEQAIILAGLTPSLRPEVLCLEDFIRLAIAVESLVLQGT
ncbi:16S rRNA (adenine(1518)-N(6)/adenine(1519)-N(6))-dimethyltransferase RsmA [Desulfopila aestuarii]|uniref:Ribosomal RNA small subunit methyltransferase A n=1 Tax=Desulfopila aestuarii DSM 18488 TaxID=1121416 RepID=A0A1M7Y1G3_9BACT|nr:16S rRNA (adenine(1518)-N(6)/adenine(1519)-N(6))-dimethyltransferase RsmA [Desulfopila aestuarii]SHO45452.1 dimethyladenosine transferase [Desulfopila aestuarii DSM 18488]